MLSITLINQRSEVGRLSALVEQFGAEHGWCSEDTSGVNLVLDEVVINVMRHGYGDDQRHEILVTLSLDDELLTMEVEDDGRPFNPVDAPPPDLDRPIEDRPIGGLGIHLVKSSVETMAYRRVNGRNILTMTMRKSET